MWAAPSDFESAGQPLTQLLVRASKPVGLYLCNSARARTILNIFQFPLLKVSDTRQSDFKQHSCKQRRHKLLAAAFNHARTSPKRQGSSCRWHRVPYPRLTHSDQYCRPGDRALSDFDHRERQRWKNNNLRESVPCQGS
jgi:hypothetical protein